MINVHTKTCEGQPEQYSELMGGSEFVTIRKTQVYYFLSPQGTGEPLQRKSVLNRGWGVQLGAVS